MAAEIVGQPALVDYEDLRAADPDQLTAPVIKIAAIAMASSIAPGR